jgi:hypothetical protein
MHPVQINPTHRLGSILKDKISGFQGTAIVRSTFHSGVIQYHLSGKHNTEKGGIEYHAFDDSDRLVLVDENPEIKNTVTPIPQNIKLGCQILDERTGIVGFLDIIQEHIDGCNMLVLQLKSKDNKPQKPHYLSIKHAVVVKDEPVIPQPVERATGFVNTDSAAPLRC